ncbi:ubiquitin-associated domain-containing protein 1 [Toxorhynchites rutilus septentrionalis]|uniref:ubiquitin-associated domain-containing protein 1 n=1 Tax=Toxorhynchites rutilus septentrionalis TaxID=329112 RepID=UPI00247ACABE|nr:ubiquitin-associated domain-containing protein 1 [Toxorhynchites rutilus septentrionalis]XP_055640445.1 ubiquitin-associated domain-containing protein 1 [Toxorhynchites rutilus septentrionalis]
MIPWMREKIAERKARWQQSRKQRGDATASGDFEDESSGSASSSSAATNASSSPAGSSFRGSPSRGFRFSSKHHHSKQQQQQQATTSADRSKCHSSSSVRPGSSSASSAATTLEESLPREGAVLLRIISPRGGIVCVEIARTSNGIQLKMHALEKFSSCSFSLPHFSTNIEEVVEKYKLIRVRNRLVFQDGDTLEKLDVTNEEEFLLVVKRTDFIPPEKNSKGPSLADVLAATKHVSLTSTNQPNANLNVAMLPTDLQQDLRRILISLARASAFVIGTGPCALKLIALFNQRLINRRRHQVRSIETLLEMGFSLDKIHQALEVTKNVFPAALDWLIQNDSSAKLLNCDKTTTGPTVVGNENNEASTSSGSPTTISAKQNFEDVSYSNLDSMNDDGTTGARQNDAGNEEIDDKPRFEEKMEHVETLLDIIRQYSDRDVFPAPEMVTSIVEMGFDERHVQEALVATRNNQAAACEWLLGNRSKSLTELRDGLPQNSPILQVLLASPQVQISLGNPKMFIALLSMLDNSSTMTMWLSDNDTASVLGHILRTYHEEKHIVAINQFNNAQSFN